MPGSWNQIPRSVIADIKETFRLHFKQVTSTPVNLSLLSWPVDYRLALQSNVYGGSLVEDEAIVHDGLPGKTQLTPQAASLTIEAIIPPTRELTASALTIQHAPMQWEMPPILIVNPQVPHPQFQSIPPLPLQSSIKKLSVFLILKQSALKTAKRLTIQPLQKLKTYTIPKVKGQIQKLGQQALNMPILRQSIPPHRFAHEKRNHFRTLLAAKAGVPSVDIKLVQIYDRLVPALYQSINTLADGNLQCIPKSLVQRQAAPQSAESVYWIVGASIQNPNQIFQIAVPIAEVS